MLATRFELAAGRRDAIVEREAGISAWRLPGSSSASARVVGDSSDGRLVVCALTVYDRMLRAPEDQQPGSGPSSRLVPVEWSDGGAVSVRQGQALGVRLRYTAGREGAGSKYRATVEIVADGAIVGRLPAEAADPAIDPTIEWTSANQWGIQQSPYGGVGEVIDPLVGAWWAGHVQCALVLGPDAGPESGTVLAGTNGGGIWQVLQTTQEIGELQARPLTDDWADTPFISALCQGPDDSEHIYAAAWGLKRGSLRETAAEDGGHSIYQWREITLPPGLAALSWDWYAPAITQVAVTNTAPRRIVISSTVGLYWAVVPAPGGIYEWVQVTTMVDGSPFPAGSYSSVAAGAGGRIVAAGAQKIFWGDWSAGGLLMNAADIQFGAVPFPEPMGWTSIAVATGEPAVQYAVAAVIASASNNNDPPMSGVFISGDNGQTWASVPAGITGTGKSLPEVAGIQGTYNNCIAISPSNSAVVAVGWQAGHFVSTDGGQTFTGFSDPSLHSDVHGLYFDPWQQPDADHLYVCSDGGICLTRDGGKTFDSSFNRNLANLQCYATYVTRDYYGTLDATSEYLATGLQDNHNVYCLLPPWESDPTREQYFTFTTPWVPVGGGDGGCVVVLPTSQLCFNPNSAPAYGMTIENSYPPALVPPGQPPETIPVEIWGFTDQAGIPSPRMVRVPEPSYANARGELMYAVCFPLGSLTVCGLFADGEGNNLHWEQVGSISSNTAGDSIAAIAPLADGSQILVTTAISGLSGLLDLVPGEVVSASSIPVSIGSQPGDFTRIVFPAPDTAFAAYNWNNGGIVLAYDGQGWQPTPGQIPVHQYFNDGIYGLAVNKGFRLDAAAPPLIFASTNDAVYVSRDRATTWLNCSTGLAACPQGADIQCADGPTETSTGVPLGGSVLYLGTWGRSVWTASLKKAEAGPPALSIGP
jgi:hypothetical protein